MKSVRQTIAGSRNEYISDGLNEGSISANPVDQFEKWIEEAVRNKLNLPNAMHLATAGLNGRPSGRIMLLRGFDERGFTFYTNYESRKGSELRVNNYASMTFFWNDLFRQVRIEGKVFKLPPEESDSYFLNRPRESKISAIVSEQSRILKSREILEERFNELGNRLTGQFIERPVNWGGFYLSPLYIEFWQGRAHRLHDRIVYKRQDYKNTWKVERLYP